MRLPNALPLSRPAGDTPHSQDHPPLHHGGTIAALGVVFGDIGTSPLYTLRVAIDASGDSSSGAVLGILSLILWAMVLVIGVKYVGFILAMDNGGEGGILALSARAGLHHAGSKRGRNLLLFVAAAGAALMFGDAVITPAISVLSAIEGVGHLSPLLAPWTLWISVAVLISLFVAQRLGVSRISAVFGPIMLTWFAVIAAVGVHAIYRNPMVLQAFDPRLALSFGWQHPGHLFVVLGAVFLAVTGGEALYADLGQFGRRAISRAWLWIAFPALVLNYFGQGAHLLHVGASNVAHPFYALFPEWAQWPAILLATAAAIIASQAVITGLFSLARQGIKLQLLPPMRVIAMSTTNLHDVYLPFVNLCLMVLSLTMVILFKASDNLADAYGISVAGAMITTTLLFVYSLLTSPPPPSAWAFWRWGLILPIVALDLLFGAALSAKLMSGGALPVSFALVVLWVIYAWRFGTQKVIALAAAEAPLPAPQSAPLPGSAVFLARSAAVTPRALAQLRLLAGVRFEKVVTVTVATAARPHIEADRAIHLQVLPDQHWHVTLHSGFLQRINLPHSLTPVLRHIGLSPEQTLYVVGLERCLPPRPIRSPQAMLLYTYAVLTRLAMRRADQFALPPERTLEVGVPIQL